MKSKGTGNPMKSRSCLAAVRWSLPAAVLFTEERADNEPSQGAVCISSSKDSRGMSRMGDGKKFSHFSLAVLFL